MSKTIIPLIVKSKTDHENGMSEAVIECKVNKKTDIFTYKYGLGYDNQNKTDCWTYSIEAKKTPIDQILLPTEIPEFERELFSLIVFDEYRNIILEINELPVAYRMQVTLDYMVMGSLEENALVPMTITQVAYLQNLIKDKIKQLKKQAEQTESNAS